LPELHWAIVGQGEMEQPIRAEIERLKLEHRVHLVAGLEDPHQVLGQADVFVLSSRSEGLGSSILAAMAQGVPVVATRVGGVSDLLESGAGLMVEPADPDRLSEAVKRLLADSSLQRSLVTKAKEEIGKYRPSAMAEQVLSVYRSCAHLLDGA